MLLHTAMQTHYHGPDIKSKYKILYGSSAAFFMPSKVLGINYIFRHHRILLWPMHDFRNPGLEVFKLYYVFRFLSQLTALKDYSPCRQSLYCQRLSKSMHAGRKPVISLYSLQWNHLGTSQKCPDYQGVLIFQVSLHNNVSFGTTARCVDYAGVHIFKCPD